MPSCLHPPSAEGTASSMKSLMKIHCVSYGPHCSSFTFMGCGRASTTPRVSHPCFFVHAWPMRLWFPHTRITHCLHHQSPGMCTVPQDTLLSTPSTVLFKLTTIPPQRAKTGVFVVDTKCIQRKNTHGSPAYITRYSFQGSLLQAFTGLLVLLRLHFDKLSPRRPGWLQPPVRGRDGVEVTGPAAPCWILAFASF